MTQITPPPNSELVEELIQETATQGEFHFIPGELEPIAPKKKFPAILKQAVRPMFFGAIGIHALLLFTPLKMTQQTKPKETAEPVKLARLSDKVLVKSLPKVKVTAAPKKVDLPKIAVASTNPVVVKLPEPEKPKVEEKKTEPEKSPDKKPQDKNLDNKKSDSKKSEESSKASEKGADPSTVDPKKATTNEKDASKLDAESQQFGSVIAGLRSMLNPGEAEADADANFLDDPTPFFNIKPPPQGNTLISNQEVEEVEASLKGQFSEKFAKKPNYGGGLLYEAKIGGTTRYVSLIKTNSGKGVMVFLWEKSPM
jgi:hypothetical protein